MAVLLAGVVPFANGPSILGFSQPHIPLAPTNMRWTNDRINTNYSAARASHILCDNYEENPVGFSMERVRTTYASHVRKRWRDNRNGRTTVRATESFKFDYNVEAGVCVYNVRYVSNEAQALGDWSIHRLC